MKPLIVLITVFGINLLTLSIVNEGHLLSMSDYRHAGRIAMSIMLGLTATGHFAFTEGMQLMVPPFIPFKKQLVLFTGLLEIMAAIGILLSTNVRLLAGWCLVIFFVMVLPANIYAALNRVHYRKANNEGQGPAYLWFRVPLQLFFIGWVWFFVLH